MKQHLRTGSVSEALMCTRTQGGGGGGGGGVGFRSQWQYLKCPYADPGQNWRN